MNGKGSKVMSSGSLIINKPIAVHTLRRIVVEPAL